MTNLPEDYPTTKAQWQEYLADVEKQLADQGAVVDARLLKRAKQVRELIDTWEDDE